ncbi:MAG: hypothetical protein LUE15_06955 [Oscillospiraceae bacterium]|nr:hypothetical protein [Oscillospiraceae bacterium]
MKRALTLLLLALTLTLALPTAAFADTGPKPTVQVEFTDMPDEVFYATLLSETSSTGPYSVYDGTEDNDGWRGEYGSDSFDREIWRAFVDYEDADGFCFLQVYWSSSETGELKWTYRAPEVYKILLYFPESGDFCVSPVYERYAMNSSYTVSLADWQSGEISAERSYDYTQEIISFLLRCAVTIAVELAVALLFGLRGRRLLELIAVVNVITQVLLNILLSRYIHMNGCSGTAAFIFGVFYLALEIIVFLIEGAVYCRLAPRRSERELTRGRLWLYAFTANAVSYLLGVFAAFMTAV